MERRTILNEDLIKPMRRYYNYCTLYTDKVCTRKHHRLDVCFSYLTFSSYNKATIRIPKNHTFYTKSEILDYLDFLKLFQLDINIPNKIREFKEYYLITVTKINKKIHFKIFCTLLRNLYEEHVYKLTHIPYWHLYIHTKYPELNVLQCNIMGHLYQRKREELYRSVGGHTVIDRFDSVNIDMEKYKNKLSTTIGVQSSFYDHENGIVFRNYTYNNEEELEQRLIELKWIEK